MPACFPGPCGRTEKGPGMVKVGGAWVCHMCDLMPGRFQPLERCAKEPRPGKRCRFAAGHKGDCELASGDRSEGNPARDGAPKLAGERERDPIFEPRKRVGPHR